MAPKRKARFAGSTQPTQLRYDESNDDASTSAKTPETALFFIPALHSIFLLRHCAEISTDQKFEACRKQLRLIGLVASIDPERALSESGHNIIT